MSETRFTPEPWNKVTYGNDVGPDDDGFWEWYEAGPARVNVEGRSPKGQLQAKADAELIAQAPVLYRLLWRTFQQNRIRGFLDPRQANEIETALARARGEEPTNV